MKKVISLFLSIMMLLSITAGIDFSAYANTYSGSCGTNVKYTFDDSTGILEISGTGKMNNYTSSNKPPYFSNSVVIINEIKKVIINNGVTSIGNCAFYERTKLTSITIPDSVTSIGSSAFNGCTGLTSITIPDSVTSIGSSAFNGCTGLTSITIPDSVTSIGYKAFYGCSSLTNITIPDGVTSIGDSAFSGCTGLKELTMPCSAKIYNSQNTFYNCTNIEKVTLTKGTGKMQNYGKDSSGSATNTYYQYTPWYISRNSFKKLVIEDGVSSIGNYAFSYCTGLTSITIPDSVTSIGSSAFSGCSGLTRVNISDLKSWCNTSFGDVSSNPLLYAHNLYLNNSLLTSITIPDNVTSIGSYAFAYCSSLTSITIPDSVTTIGSYAFYGCTGLTSVTIPSSVTSIGDYAFRDCTGLTSVTIPDSVTSIGDYAFYGCTGLTSITIPDSVTSIGNYTFYRCNGLTSITIPDSVTSIGEYAFYNCSSLTNVTIPDSVTNIGDHAFYNCSSLTSITIPDSVTSIGNFAFYDCTCLKELTMPCSAKIYNSHTFYNCTNIEKVTLTKGTGKMQNYGKDSSGSATNTYYQYTPWYISRNNFKTLVIEDGITSIGSYAFSGCTGLTKTTIPDSVTSIGSDAFSGCTGLTSITIPDSVTSIGDNAFYGCGTIIYPGTASGSPWGADVRYSIIDNGFAYNDNEKTQLAKYLGNESVVVIPDGVTSIGSSSFRGYTGLTSITIPDSVTNIGNYAFYGCTGLTRITIPDSVTSIGDFAFSVCTGLTSITIPDSVTNIDGYAFYSCTELKELTMPCSANYSYAFGGCSNIEKITLTKGTGIMKDYDSSSYMNTPWYISRNNLKEIVLEDGITKIGNYVFYDCTGLERITIPSSVTSIGNNAFNTLTEVTIPASMKIDFSGFDGCTNLQKINLTPGSGTMADWSLDYQDSLWYKHKETIKEVKLEEGIKNISESAFYECTNLAKTNVPSTVDSIGRYAYYGCDNLRNLTISSMQCKIPDNPNTISSFATIYAPSGSTAEQYAVKYNRDFESTGEYVPALIPEGASVKVNGDKAVITLSDGSTITVPKDTKETVKNADGTYTVTLNDGKSVTVSSNTEITKTADGQLNVKATDNGKTTTVTVPSGSSVVKSGDSYVIKVVNGTQTVEKTVAAGETVVIDKSGAMSCNGNHKWDKGVVTIAATCTSEGVKTYTCSVCGNQKIEKLKKVAHKPVADKVVPATFISAGKTAGTHCSVCGKIIVAQKPVAMLGAAKLSKVKKGKKSFTATWKSVANVDGYEIQYSLKKNMKKAKTKSVASSKKKLKVKKLKAKKKYYVRIRAYKVINGKKQYSAWSAKKKVKTK